MKKPYATFRMQGQTHRISGDSLLDIQKRLRPIFKNYIFWGYENIKSVYREYYYNPQINRCVRVRYYEAAPNEGYVDFLKLIEKIYVVYSSNIENQLPLANMICPHNPNYRLNAGKLDEEIKQRLNSGNGDLSASLILANATQHFFADAQDKNYELAEDKLIRLFVILVRLYNMCEQRIPKWID